MGDTEIALNRRLPVVLSVCLVLGSLSVGACSGGSGGEEANDQTAIQPDNAPPAFSGADTVDVTENETLTGLRVTASDPDGDALILAIDSSSPDAALFELTAEDDELRFRLPPDFENPVDLDGDNVYAVTVNATDGTTTTSKQFEVRVLNANDNAPLANLGVAGKVPVGQLTILDGTGSSDPDGDLLNFSWMLIDQPLGSAATITNTSSGTASILPDAPGSYLVKLTVSDGREANEVVTTITAGLVIEGIVSSDLTVPRDAELVFVSGVVQIATDVALQIGPGITVDPLSSDDAPRIEIFGSMTLAGQEAEPVSVRNMTIALRDESSAVFTAEWSRFVDSVVAPTFITTDFGAGFGSDGTINISDSTFTNGALENLERGQLLRTVFTGAGSTTLKQGGAAILNNKFTSPTGPAIIYTSGLGAQVKNNTFDMLLGEPVLDYRPFTCGASVRGIQWDVLDASENYWGTQSKSAIESMILDAGDDLGRCESVIYEPFLLSPAAGTPR